ncbi:phosphoadenylyl-sulfate reductase [Marinobacter sp. F4216]|uniref:phosphoadenylyl-sulfate reductase n=1 Tax=Marinobacter sp. F4216 TaxID=2874281 RepID=UPI001CC0818C|nr:phosphoadenylyl-sulfate reductase [Marinobacter sp. F4216]MBZ2167913.1 phosphoadenylyl-sulfate reductase [Marinobacter sp. F4216]
MNDINQLQAELQGQSPRSILKAAFQRYENIAISFSGAEDVVLIEMAHRLTDNLKVFTIDTGRLHPETYEFLEQVRKHYDLDIEVLFPDSQEVQELVRDKGLFSFYEDGHSECCGIRKVNPLRKKLAQVDAWITGQRKDQSPGTRNDVPTVQLDSAFSTPAHPLVKFNPLANWSSQEVWDYIRISEAPYNKLHEKGFVSIGCQPCTRPVLPGQHEREGRWWWEEATKKECGLHADNLIASTQSH